MRSWYVVVIQNFGHLIQQYKCNHYSRNIKTFLVAPYDCLHLDMRFLISLNVVSLIILPSL